MGHHHRSEVLRHHSKQAQQTGREMTPQELEMAQAQDRPYAEPAPRLEGDCFRIVVRPEGEFSALRYHDVGEKGHAQRIAGKRSDGTWDTQAWLIHKEEAHIEGDILVGDTADARMVLQALGSVPRHVEATTLKPRPGPVSRRARSRSAGTPNWVWRSRPRWPR